MWERSVVSSTPDRGGCLNPRLVALLPVKRLDFHYGRRLVGTMAGLDAYGENKMSYPIGIRTQALSDSLC